MIQQAARMTPQLTLKGKPLTPSLQHQKRFQMQFLIGLRTIKRNEMQANVTFY